MAVPKIVVGCQGGGMHAAFEVGVLTEILKDVEQEKFELVGLSGTSAGALCTLMAWYGLAYKKNGSAGSAAEAIRNLNDVWDDFTAGTLSENLMNLLTFYSFRLQETEVPVLGLNVPVAHLGPAGLLTQALTWWLPYLDVREEYIDLEALLREACPKFDDIEWSKVKTRLLISASEVVHGLETVFDSAVNSAVNKGTKAPGIKGWRQRLPLSLRGVAASGTLPQFSPAACIGRGFYWDGLYSQNPPVRDFLSNVPKEETPDEVWIVRINPQQWPECPESRADIIDRENELVGNLSLNKELDFIGTVNEMISRCGGKVAQEYKTVTVRTIKMEEAIANELRYSSKFDRRLAFTDRLRQHGHAVARDWLNRWPKDVGSYPDDAGYRKPL
jgi:NTE family protein